MNGFLDGWINEHAGEPPALRRFRESKPQQTGTGFLLRLGEVATTSGSILFKNASWCNNCISGFDPDGLGVTPSEATNFRPVVK
jgi:hypothetical protein